MLKKQKDIYLKTREKLKAYEYALTIINWDTETEAPSGALEKRSEVIGVLSSMYNDLVFNEEYINSVNYLYEHLEKCDDLFKREIIKVKKNLDSTLRLPKELIVEASIVSAKAGPAWVDAKINDDFSLFEPHLTKIVDIQKQMIKYLETDELKGYDVLLDQYEEGLTKEKYNEFFNLLKKELVPLIKEISETKYTHNLDFAKKNYPIAKQKEFAKYIASVMCFDYTRGLDKESEHPFTSGNSRYDVRLTNHYYEDYFVSSIFSMIHELGHATFEQQVSEKLDDTILGGCSAMALHESQSRFYENIVGRSYEFWKKHFPKLQEIFKEQLQDASLEDFYHYVNKAECSLIRTEADELTYPLHIMIRYDLEQALLTGEIEVKDLPTYWNKAYKDYLGVDVPNNKLGVLQDVHWAGGSFGYFPTYALGSAYSAQFFNAMKKDLNVEKEFASDNLQNVNAWLKDHVHQYGDSKKPEDILKDATGEEFNPKYYVEYLTNKYRKLYNLK